MDVENALNDGKPVGDELCRLCANTDKQFIPIFQEEGMEHNISEQIKKYLPIIRVTKVDKLPLQVCYQCTSTLLSWHNFFEQCRVADNRLREILSVNVEFNKDDESCHDYADDFRDDFDDQPSLSDRICDIPEKSVHFDLTVNEAMDSSDSVNKDSKSVTENADDSRCAARAGRKRIPLATKRRLSPSVKEERAKIVKSKKIRLLDCATAPAASASEIAPKADVASTTSTFPIASPSTSAKGKSDPPKGRQAKVEKTPSRTRFQAILPKAETKKAKSAVSKVKENVTKVPSAVPGEEGVTKSQSAILEMVAKAVASVSLKSTDEKCATQPDRKSTAETTVDGDSCAADDAPDEWHSCDHCNYTCRRKYDIKRHIANAHLPRVASDGELLTCGVCWHGYQSKSALRRHVVRKHFPGADEARAAARWNRGYCCDVCGRGYEKQREMLAHREVYHASAPPMRWSAFGGSKGKLKRCAVCAAAYRAGRFFVEHACVAADEDAALAQRMTELLRAKPNFRCDVCSAAFLWKPILRQHREVAHADAAPLNWDDVEAVEVTHYCAGCCTAFDDETVMEGHVCARTEPEARPKAHVCAECGGSYQRKSDYRRHRRLRHGADEEAADSEERRKPVIRCPYCEHCAVTRTHMVAHIKSAHDIDTESPFLCVVCNKVFKRKATLDTHNQVYHPQGENAADNERVLRDSQILLNGERAYHCAVCNRNMFNATRFLAHHRLHFVERKFTCDLCGKQTRTQHQLNTHIKIIHLNIRNHECDLCGKSFHSKQSCEEHRRIHTGERPFSCEICGKTFVAMNALFTHKKFHDDFFAHACHLCPKKFKVRRSLTNHIRTHTGERPFQCDICSKTFNNSSRFSYHKKVTHSDNRPHRCEQCGSRFKANKFLLRHMKLHKTRTHIQFRRRNNPEYFAAQEAAAAAAVEATRNDPQKGLFEIVNDEAKQAPMEQPQIEYKILEGESPLVATTVGSIVYCDAVSASVVCGARYADMVDVSLHFAQRQSQLQTADEGFAGSATAPTAPTAPTVYPSSSAT